MPIQNQKRIHFLNMWCAYKYSFVGSQKNKKYLQVIMGVLTQAQNGDEQFWKYKFHAANGKVQHAFMMGLGFFFLGGVILCFSSLINLFPLPLA
jgi:hypothetical protein